jgi:hypothetical protein
MLPEETRSHSALIDTYFRIVATDTYERFSDIITDDCTFSLMPIGYTFKGKKDVMRFVTTAGGARRHDKESKITITNWFATGEHFCVEYEHSFIVDLLNSRMTIDGYCLVVHIVDGKFDAFREYINPSRISISVLTTYILRMLPFASRIRGRK